MKVYHVPEFIKVRILATLTFASKSDFSYRTTKSRPNNYAPRGKLVGKVQSKYK